MSTGINANPWNISMDNDFNERFEEYRVKFKKIQGITLTKSEFGRFMFEFWEKEYLLLLGELEENTKELTKIIETNKEKLSEMTPGKDVFKAS